MHVYLLLFSILFSTSAFSKKEKILLVNSYHKGFEWVDDYSRAIIETLGKDYEIHSHDMNTKRIPKKDFENAAIKVIKKFDQLKPSVVILGDDNALSLTGSKLLKKKANIVFLGINNNPREYFNSQDLFKMHGVLEQPLIRRSITFLQEILSSKLKVARLQYDTCNSSEYVIERSFHGEKSLSLGSVTTKLNQVTTYEQWQKGIKEAKAKGFDALFAGFYYCLFDKNKKHVNHDKIIKWSAINTQIPIFAFWDFAVGEKKAIGGYVISGYGMGKQAALITKDLLNGIVKVGSKRIVSFKKGTFLFSKSQLKKWNIKLPPHIKKSAKFIK